MRGDERGSVSAELVLATPLLLVLIMGVVQFALWQHAEHVADAVAQQGLAVGRLQGETAAAGQVEAQSVLDQLGTGVLVGPDITATRTATTTTVVVTGHAESVFGLFSLPVTAVASGPTEDYGSGSSAMTFPARLKREETGSVVAELVLLTPLLILVLLFVVALGRLAGARIDVDGAAAQAARAASIARDPATATAMAQQTATAALGSDNVTCAQLSVSTDTAQFQPGGLVAVTVTCTVSLSDLTGLRLPASESISSRFVEVVDTYRSAT